MNTNYTIKNFCLKPKLIKGHQMVFKDFSESELYEVQWRPVLNLHKDRPASRENSVAK